MTAQVGLDYTVTCLDKCRSQKTVLAAQGSHTGQHNNQFAIPLAVVVSNCPFTLFKELPFTFRNRSGQLVGYDIDLAHVLAGDLGVKLVLVNYRE